MAGFGVGALVIGAVWHHSIKTYNNKVNSIMSEAFVQSMTTLDEADAILEVNSE